MVVAAQGAADMTTENTVPTPERWIMHAPVVSAAHISEETAEWLDRKTLHRPTVSSIVWAFAGGWLIDAAAAFYEKASDMPDDIWQVCAWGVEGNFEWVRIDRDGDLIADLPVFDW